MSKLNRRSLICAAALCVLALAPSASAADTRMKAVPLPASVYNWSGFYVGGNVGGTFDNSVVSGGAQIGYNIQSGSLLFGIELDFQAAKIRSHTTSSQAFPASVPGAPLVCRLDNPFVPSRPNGVDLTDPNSGFSGVVQAATGAPFVTTAEQCASIFSSPQARAIITGAYGAPAPATSIVISPSAVTYSLSGALDWFGTLRGRFGFEPTNGLLLYVTGGLAYGEGQLALATTTGTMRIGFTTFTPTTTTFSTFLTTSNKILIGYAIGGGAEYAFNRHWSMKGEYLYVDLGEAGIGDQRVSFNTSVARLGINYRF